MPSRITGVRPPIAIEGGRVELDGHFSVDPLTLPDILVGRARARVAFASATRLAFIVPTGLDEIGRAHV